MFDKPQSRVFAVMVAASFASTIGGLPFNALPILLGSLADHFQLSATQSGLLGSACFTGYFTGTVAAFFIINRISWRLLTLVAAVMASASLFLSSISPWHYQSLLWGVVGFFAALMTCLGLRIMGEMENKERALGLRQGIELGVTALVLFLLPAYVIVSYGYPGAAICLLLIILMLSTSAYLLPKRSSTPTKIHFLQQVKLPGMAWCALALFFLFGSGNIGLWAFLERMGNSLDLAPAELGTVFAVLKLLGGGAAFVLAVVGDRLGMKLPYLIVFLVIVAGLLLLAGAEGFTLFALGAWVWEVGFTWGCIYMTATVARLDSMGRAIMLIPAAFALSSMVGPAVAGAIIATSYLPLLIFAAVSSLISLFVFAQVMADQIAQDSPVAEEIAPIADVA